MVDKLRNFAKRYLKQKLGLFKGDVEMDEMVRGDYKDMCAVATLISNRKFEKAYYKLDDLDTNVREAIPLYIWNYLHKKCEIACLL